MTDAELAAFLGLSEIEAARIIPKLTDWQREGYEAMAGLESEISLWQAGLGRKPRGAILCRASRFSGARA